METGKALMALYSRLDAELETRNWKQEWPGESPYEIAVGAVLAQNTNWKNAEKAISNLKAAGLLDEREVLKAPNPKLETLIRPAGFYRQKAIRLKTMTETWLKIRRMDDVAEMRKRLLETHGIGNETADSILLYALHKPVFVVDAYTRRFCSHFLRKEFKAYDEYRKFFESNLPKDVGLYKRYHALIVEWGKSTRTNLRKI